MTTIFITGTHPITPRGVDFSIYKLRFKTSSRGDWANTVTPVLTLIKGLIPASDRAFNPSTKEWEISAAKWPSLEQILKAMPSLYLSYVDSSSSTSSNKAEERVIVDKEYAESFYQSSESVQTSSSISQKGIQEALSDILNIKMSELRSMSDIDLKRIYRKTALILHPDRNNGDGSKMSELNMYYNLYIQK